MSKDNSSSSNGIGVLGLLGVAFVVLKLTEVIDWSWWYVTMPFWGGIVLLIGGLLIWLMYELFKPTRKPMVHTYNKHKKKSGFQARLEEMAKQKAENREKNN